MARDNGRCRSCNRPGDEVDHVRGSDNHISNLQLLCSDCHREKTMRNFERISPATHPEEWAKAVALERRAKASEPSRLCDHPDWTQLWRTIAAARRRSVAALVSR
ncbi:MAG: HNH endonuclease [Acidobacteriota bacterium]|nr:HNH endonuclease [Acidobacteriota bacterium]